MKKKRKKKGKKMTGRTMIQDPLAADLAEEANHNMLTEMERRREEFKDRIKEDSGEESDFESKINKLKGKKDIQ